MRRGIIAVVTCITLAAAAGAQPGAPQVQVSRSVDRTAVWVGDAIRYTLEFTSAGDLDVLSEDVARERLPVKNADVLHHETSERQTAAGRVRRVDYTLTSFAAGTPEIIIEGFTVRYFSRRAVGETQGASAGQVSVPRTVIPIRSTLPDTGRLPELRARRALRTAPRYFALARPVGVALMVIAVVPVALLLLDVAGQVRRVRSGAPRRRARRAHKGLYEELAARHPDSAPEQVAAFERLDRLVRDHLELAASIPARAMTPAEIAAALRARGGRPDAAEPIEALLSRCERARYAPEPPGLDAWREAVTSAEPILKRHTF